MQDRSFMMEVEGRGGGGGWGVRGSDESTNTLPVYFNCGWKKVQCLKLVKLKIFFSNLLNSLAFDTELFL